MVSWWTWGGQGKLLVDKGTAAHNHTHSVLPWRRIQEGRGNLGGNWNVRQKGTHVRLWNTKLLFLFLLMNSGQHLIGNFGKNALILLRSKVIKVGVNQRYKNKQIKCSVFIEFRHHQTRRQSIRVSNEEIKPTVIKLANIIQGLNECDICLQATGLQSPPLPGYTMATTTTHTHSHTHTLHFTDTPSKVRFLVLSKDS